MELSCPSCGRKHRTEEYPGAFEIQCSCGYSILVPDEVALNEAPLEFPVFDSPTGPTAMEEEDAQLAIPAHELLGSNSFSPSAAIESSPGSNEMTAPEDLPEGMVYDPFELPQTPEGLEALVDEPIEQVSELSAEASADESFGDSADGGNLDMAPLEDPFADAPASASAPAAAAAVEDPAVVIERSQVAALGQLLGPDYDLELRDLGQEQLTWIVDRCRKFLDERPWLEDEIKNRHIELEQLERKGALRRVPEIFAVEIYLMCFEAGGKCRFRKAG